MKALQVAPNQFESLQPHHVQGLVDGTFLSHHAVFIDNFESWKLWHRPSAPAPIFLLTHAHRDHFDTLSANFSGGLVYCTELTKQLVMTILKESHPDLSEDWFIIQAINEEFVIDRGPVRALYLLISFVIQRTYERD